MVWLWAFTYTTRWQIIFNSLLLLIFVFVWCRLAASSYSLASIFAFLSLFAFSSLSPPFSCSLSSHLSAPSLSFILLSLFFHFQYPFPYRQIAYIDNNVYSIWDTFSLILFIRANLFCLVEPNGELICGSMYTPLGNLSLKCDTNEMRGLNFNILWIRKYGCGCRNLQSLLTKLSCVFSQCNGEPFTPLPLILFIFIE